MPDTLIFQADSGSGPWMMAYENTNIEYQFIEEAGDAGARSMLAFARAMQTSDMEQILFMMTKTLSNPGPGPIAGIDAGTAQIVADDFLGDATTLRIISAEGESITFDATAMGLNSLEEAAVLAGRWLANFAELLI